MPIIKSAIKRVKQQAKAQARNRLEKQAYRAAVKAFNAAIESKKSADISKALQSLQSQIDKLVKKNIIHKNNAARKKAGFSKRAKEAGAKTSATVKKPAAKPKTTATKKSPAKKPASKKA